MSVKDVTPNERAALLAVCQRGATDASAARQLAISERALRARLQRLYVKLGVNSAAQAYVALFPIRDAGAEIEADRQRNAARRERENSPTTLYRYFDQEGALLYVGIAYYGWIRAGEHEHTAPWWAEVSSATFEHFPTRPGAADAERRAIRTEDPHHNRTGRP